MNKQSRIAPADASVTPLPGASASFPAKASPVLGDGAAREAEARVAPTPSMPCPDCDDGTTYWMALDATEWELGACRTCEGSRVVEATCETCDGALDKGWCQSCDDFGLVYVERIAPGRVAV